MIAMTIRFWRLLQAKRREPDSLTKMAIGAGMTCGAFLILATTSALSAGLFALPWLLAFFVLLDFSFIWGEPPLRAFVSRHAPASRATVMMSLAIMSIAIANFIVGWLGRFYEHDGRTGSAEHLYVKALAAAEHVSASDPRRVAVLRALAALYAVQERRAEASQIERALATPAGIAAAATWVVAPADHP